MSDQLNDGEQVDERPGKSELLSRIYSSRAALEDALNSLDEELLTRPGREGWSIRDHLAHLAAWEAGMVALLQQHPRLQAMGLDPREAVGLDTDQINDLVQRRHAHLSLQEVMAFFQEAHRQMIETLNGMSDEDLNRPYRDYVPGGDDSRQDPVIDWIIGNTYEHFNEHLGYIRVLVNER